MRSDTINDIKAKIQDEKLLFFRGKQLEDGKTLADYGIIRNCAIRLHFGLQIFVKIVYEEKYTDFFCPSQTITLGVESFDAIEHVKTKIQEKKGILPIRQRLIFVGKQLEDKWTLADCCIQNKSTLHLELHPRQRMHIKVQTMDGKTIIFEELQSSDSIWNLKDKLCEKKGILPHQQRLIYAGRLLEDGRTLAHYEIQNDSLLLLVLRIGGGPILECFDQ